MTRDEHRVTMSMVPNIDYCKGYNSAVEYIFDDIESQQCQNCAYWDKVEQNYDPRKYGECSKHISATPSNLTVEDFGCNKFKEKQ